MKVSELEGAELDYWTAKADGHEICKIERGILGNCEQYCIVIPKGFQSTWHPYNARLWQTCGPLIEKYIQNIEMLWDGRYEAIPKTEMGGYIGDTPQQAICRAVVASVYGDEVDD